MNESAPTRGIGRPAAWLLLAVVGQAAALALIDAGPFVRYQHYAISGATGGARLIALGVVVVQALIVGRVLFAHRVRVRALLHRCAGGWRLPVIAVVVFLASATLSRDVAVYVAELCFAFALVLVNLGNIGLVAAALPGDRLGAVRRFQDRVLGASGPQPGPGLDRFSARAALWVVLATAALSLTVYERHPHIPDEVSYIIHARYFGNGWVTMPTPPVAEAFELDLMTFEEERWYSPVPPGWPAVLAVGVRAGVDWLVNPVLAGIALLLTYLLVWSAFDRRTARLTLLLFCVSPWFLFMGMSYLTHPASLVAALAALVAMSRFVAGGRLGWAWLSGLCLGAVGLIRPLEAVIVGLVLAAWAVSSGGYVRRLTALISLGLGSLPLTALHVPYNQHLTGSATTMPILAYTDAMYGPGSNSLGFGPNRGLGWTGLDPFPGHGLIDVLVNANLNVFALNVELFGWGFGSLLVLGIFLFSGAMRKRDWGFFAALLMVVGIHSFYWFSGGPDFGARYWYLVILPCVVLTARGIEYLTDRVGGRDGPRAMVGVAAASLVALLVFVPWRSIDKYRDYRAMQPGIRQLARQHDFGNSLVIVRGHGFPDYSSTAVYNPLDLSEQSPLYAWDRGEAVRRRLASAFPARRFWIVDGPSITGDDFRVIAGPLEAGQLSGLRLEEPQFAEPAADTDADPESAP